VFEGHAGISPLARQNDKARVLTFSLSLCLARPQLDRGSRGIANYATWPREVRLRFAPSPLQEPLHIGGATKPALYQLPLCQKNGWKILLRIEDTDQNRLCPGAVKNYIKDSLELAQYHLDASPWTLVILLPIVIRSANLCTCSMRGT